MNAPTQLKKFKGELSGNKKTYRALLRGDETATLRYLAEASEAIAANPDLLNAHRGSLHAAIGTAASMGLSILPVLGEAYLIPRNRNIGSYDDPHWTQWVNFQIGYKGLVKLAHRSNLIDSLFVEVAYRGEEYVYRGGTDPGIDHSPDDEYQTRQWDDIIAAYAVVHLKGSTRPTFVNVSRKELADVRKSTSSKYKDCSDPWAEHPEAMCKKTALIRVAKLLPREDKLRDFHVAVGHELALEGGRVSQIIADDFMLDDARPSLVERTMGDEATPPKVDRRWREAVTHYGHLGVRPEELLAFLGVESADDIDDEGFARLEATHGQIRTRATTVDAVFRNATDAEDASGPDSDEDPENTDPPNDPPKDEDIPF